MVKLITNKSFLSIQDRKRHRRVVNNSGHKGFRKAKTFITKHVKIHNNKSQRNLENLKLRKVKSNRDGSLKKGKVILPPMTSRKMATVRIAIV